MKIMHVCKKYPWALGGDAVVIANLQKQQQATGSKTVIVTSNCNEIANGRHIYKIGLKDTPEKLDAITLRRVISLFILGWRMFGIVSKERPDVIHTHSVDMAFFVSFAARWFHIPVVHTFHIVTFYDAKQSLLRRKSELWLAKKAKARSITAPNVYDVKKLQAVGLTQTTLLPNGVNPTFWENKRPATPNKTFSFLAIGRLETQKGYEYLIKAAAALCESGSPPFHITIVGTGTQETLLQYLVDILQLEDVVTFAGRKSQEEIRLLLAEADAAVFPSLYETTPLTLLEAWAAGVPAIVTPVGIVRGAQANFDAAHIVPLQDAQALAKAMSHLMAHPKTRKALAAAGKKEAKKYSWPEIAHTAAIIYEEAQ